MLAGMDDREDPEDLITMEAMSGLARIFAQIDEGHVRPILINIALRIRPCFEKVSLLYCQKEREMRRFSNCFQPTPAVRAAAFTLFGSLSRFGNGPSEGPFLEQIQTNFVSLLVHLNEADPSVVEVRICSISCWSAPTTLCVYLGLQRCSAEAGATHQVTADQ